ncbi:MAG: hypothetical protein FWG03_03480 [Clostridiales bacterium]|nr:hypothetical protein [Clostridiales bacterium]
MLKVFEMAEKITWHGKIVSIQPRTRVWRYITHNRTHYEIGYNLFLEGQGGEGEASFVVAISEKQQEKAAFRVGDTASGTAWTKEYPNREYADYYRAGSLKKLGSGGVREKGPPPWTIPPLSMEAYARRGARMLSKSRWRGKCYKCIFATMSNVEIQWDFDRDIKKYRFESFCYGPFSCKHYSMGRPRAVPYKKDHLSAIDDGVLDELCTDYRGEDPFEPDWYDEYGDGIEWE